MKIKQTLVLLLAPLIIGIATVGFASPALAQDDKCPTAIIDVDCDQDSDKVEDSGVWQLLLLALNIMTAGVGIAAVGGIIWAAILYSSASDNADQVKKSKDIIRDVAIGLISYALMYLFLNFLIPGGIFT